MTARHECQLGLKHDAGGAADEAQRARHDALGSDDDLDALSPTAAANRPAPPRRPASAASAGVLAGWSDASKQKLVALFETVRSAPRAIELVAVLYLMHFWLVPLRLHDCCTWVTVEAACCGTTNL
jgi:hypothetical protein